MQNKRLAFMWWTSTIFCPSGALIFVLIYCGELFLLRACPIWVRGPQASQVLLAEMYLRDDGTRPANSVLSAYDLAAWMTDLKKTQAYAIFALWFTLFGQFLKGADHDPRNIRLQHRKRLEEIVRRCTLSFPLQLTFAAGLSLVLSGATLGLPYLSPGNSSSIWRVTAVADVAGFGAAARFAGYRLYYLFFLAVTMLHFVIGLDGLRGCSQDRRSSLEVPQVAIQNASALLRLLVAVALVLLPFYCSKMPVSDVYNYASNPLQWVFVAVLFWQVHGVLDGMRSRAAVKSHEAVDPGRRVENADTRKVVESLGSGMKALAQAMRLVPKFLKPVFLLWFFPILCFAFFPALLGNTGNQYSTSILAQAEQQVVNIRKAMPSQPPIMKSAVAEALRKVKILWSVPDPGKRTE